MTTPPQVQSALQRIKRVCEQRPELQSLGKINAEFIGVLFPNQPGNVATLALPNVPAGAEQVPLFRTTLPPLVDADLCRNWNAVSKILTMNDAYFPAAKLARDVPANAFDLAQQVATVFHMGPESFRAWLLARGLYAALGVTILRLSCLPLLAPLAESNELAGWQSAWRQGRCPLCGNWPLLAELRGLEQLRWLRCGWCAAQWQLDRLFCPFCGNRDHRQHRDLFVDGQEQGSRLSVCGACQQSLPSIPTLARLTAPELLVAEMETLHWRVVRG